MRLLNRFAPLLAGAFALLAGASSAEEAPKVVSGLALVGAKTRAITVTVRNKDGELRSESRPSIAVLKNSPWSQDDPVRDGAREFEVLLTVGRLLKHHSLGGVVGLGNRHGRLMPDTEKALNHSALMGVPVVKVAALGGCAVPFDENFLVEAGSLSEVDAVALLEQCMLRYGALPPALDAANPTDEEITAIRGKISLYQAAFNAAEPALVVAAR